MFPRFRLMLCCCALGTMQIISEYCQFSLACQFQCRVQFFFLFFLFFQIPTFQSTESHPKVFLFCEHSGTRHSINQTCHSELSKFAISRSWIHCFVWLERWIPFSCRERISPKNIRTQAFLFYRCHEKSYLFHLIFFHDDRRGIRTENRTCSPWQPSHCSHMQSPK